MDELLEQFVIEGRELVQQASDDLLAIAETGYDPVRTDSAFRAIHTLKGSVGLFDMQPFAIMLHAAEDAMAACRASRRPAPPDTLDALLDCLGVADRWIEAIALTGRLPQDAALQAAALADTLRSGLAAATAPANGPTVQPDWVQALIADGQGKAASAFRYVPAQNCFFLGEDPLARVREVTGLLALRLEPRTPWQPANHAPFACNLVIRGLSASPADSLRQTFRLVSDQVQVVALAERSVAAAQGAPMEAATRMLRVPASRIDGLADLVGELFITKNRLAFLASQLEGGTQFRRDIAAAQASLDRLAGFMHRAVMGLRLVPLEQNLRRLPRLVRETASRLGRDILFTMEGTQIQADKATVDALFEPLLHVLRNALDHGIEPPATRLASGKPAQGRITLQAALEGEQVVIRVTDDGAGIDPAALRQAAAARGLATPEDLAAMDAQQVTDLIFLPGFSTASEVTQTSGRGVGMDAVRMALQALGGQVAIGPAPGGGTAVRMSVPQSTSVLTVLALKLGDALFGVPVEAVAELARIARTTILPLQDGQAFVLRDRTIPLLSLHRLLGLPDPPAQPTAQVVIAHADGGQVGFEVDGFGARLDVVLRPLPALLAATPGVRGSAVLGDGAVLLVLDMAELAQ